MRKVRLFILLLVVSVAWLGMHSLALAEVSVEAVISPQTFSLDQGARLSIVVSGARKNVSIEEPDLENIKFHPRGQSSQTSFINGDVSSSITNNYIVQGLVAGKYTIPPITVHVGGKNYKTNSISFEITPSGTGKTETRKGTKSIKDIAFITVSETGEHYPGEIVPITLKAYFNRNYRVDLTSLPALTADGVVMPQLSSEPEQKQEVVGGEPFHVLTWKTSLSGIKTGTHKIQFSLDANLLVPQQRRRPFSQFGGSLFDDSLFDSFFGNVERKPIRATSLEHEFIVLPLPEDGKPAGFTGAIGDFTMEVTGTPLKVEVGEPITLTMTISGKGNFNRVEAPVFPEGPAWKAYSPTSAFDKDNAKYEGSKSFEQAIVVKQGGVNEIPSLTFSYFDPAKKKYVTLRSDPIPLQLQGGVSSQAGGAVAGAGTGTGTLSSAKVDVTTGVGRTTSAVEQVVAAVNLAPIHLETGSFHKRIMPLFKRGWYLTCIALLFVVIAGMVFLIVRRNRYEREPGIAMKEQRQVGLRSDVQRVEDAKESGDAALFLECCRSAIQNHVGGAASQQASAMSLTDLKHHVAGDSPLIEIFTRAEAAAYGGAGLTQDEMDKYYRELKAELEKIL